MRWIPIESISHETALLPNLWIIARGRIAETWQSLSVEEGWLDVVESDFDVFWLCAALGVGLKLLVLLMKRSLAEKGAHIGAE
jgi:hypothetical protein